MVEDWIGMETEFKARGSTCGGVHSTLGMDSKVIFFWNWAVMGRDVGERAKA